MRFLILSCVIAALSACTSAPPATAPAAPAAPQSAATGTLELSQPVCQHGAFGFHFRADGPTEGNAYYPLHQLALLCRPRGDSDAPQPERDDAPLPPGVSRL